MGSRRSVSYRHRHLKRAWPVNGISHWVHTAMTPSMTSPHHTLHAATLSQKMYQSLAVIV